MSNEAFKAITAGLEDAIAHAKGEPGRASVREVPMIDVREVRAKLALTQKAFAEAFGVSLAAVRNWEQGRRAPTGPARALLIVVDKEPSVVARALGLAKAS